MLTVFTSDAHSALTSWLPNEDGSGENGMWVEIFKRHLEWGCEVKTGVDGSGLSLSERGVCFIDVVGVGTGQW